MIDNVQIDQITQKLEAMEDEVLASQLLQEFGQKSQRWGQLMMNKDESLSHDDWKKNCDQAQADLREVIQKILSI